MYYDFIKNLLLALVMFGGAYLIIQNMTVDEFEKYRGLIYIVGMLIYMVIEFLPSYIINGYKKGFKFNVIKEDIPPEFEELYNKLHNIHIIELEKKLGR